MNGYALANAFRVLRESWRFTSTEADLYYELVGIANERGWPAGFQYSNQLICATIGISEKSLIAARNRLKQAGLLDFVSGHKRAPTAYTLLQKGLPQVSKSGSKSGSVNGSESDSPLYKELKQNENELKKKLEGERAASAAARLELERQLSEMREQVDQLRSQPTAVSAPPVAAAPPQKGSRGGRFEPPTTQQVLAYFVEQRPHNDLGALTQLADKWHAHYSAVDWKVGKTQMKDWQAGCRKWLADVPKVQAGQPQPPTSYVSRPASSQHANQRYNTTARGGFGGFAGPGPGGRAPQPGGSAPAGNQTGGPANPAGGPTGQTG